MPLPTPGFFKTDKLPKWRAALLGGWLWLRLRFRHNPGFATAAVAGSIGLVLAVILLLNGGYQAWMASRNVEPEPVANLGEDSSAKEKNDSENEDSFEDPILAGRKKTALPEQDEPPVDDDEDASFVSKVSTPREKAPVKRFDDPVVSESGKELEDTEMEADPERKPSTLALTPLKNKEKEEEGDSDDDGGGFLPDDKPTLAQSPGKASIALPADVEEENPATDEVELQPLPAKKNTRSAIPEDDPLVAREEEEAEGEADMASSGGTGTTIVKSKEPETVVEEDLEPVTTPAMAEEPPADTRPRSGWKYSTTKPGSGKAAPPLPVAEQESSEEVQTTIHAGPVEPEVKPQIERASVNPEPAKPQAGSSPLRLEVKAPAQVNPGQSFDLEFVVTNMGNTSAKGAMLSVALPAGLNHPMGPELERPVPQLGPRQAYRVRLTVKAISAGTARPQADVSFGGRPATKSAPTIEVRKAIGPQAKVPSDCYCAPVRPLTY